MIAELKTKTQTANPQATSVIGLVTKLIDKACQIRASDIHIDPQEQSTRIRIRVDGVLKDFYSFPKELHQAIISRLKVLSRLRIDEHQAAQDGRFRVNVEKETVDIRLSIMPTYYGENAVLRILSDHAQEFDFEALGFSPANAEIITKALQKPNGMILSTGPTGSGKTTTLYTMIKAIKSESISIITIEDPIEYSIPGVSQIQVNNGTDLNFANGLRSVLRQDPNVIMVGEIRDFETAAIAVNTSLTGHLLLSTLHTTDAATSLPRLLDLKIEPFLIATTICLVIGQRLVRKICPYCLAERELTKAEIAHLSQSSTSSYLANKGTVVFGRGCDFCAGTGYSGRTGINELLVVNDEIRNAIMAKASSREIKQAALANGMTSMLEDGFNKVKDGITTIEEVLRVIHE